MLLQKNTEKYILQVFLRSTIMIYVNESLYKASFKLLLQVGYFVQTTYSVAFLHIVASVYSVYVHVAISVNNEPRVGT